MSVKKNDNVIVITGKDKGKKGKVLKVFPGDQKILVEGINMSKRRQRPKKSGQKGQIIEKATPLHLSNVKVVCPQCKLGVRTGSKVVGDKKFRICKKCQSEM